MKVNLAPSTVWGKWSLYSLSASVVFLVAFFGINAIFHPEATGGFFSAWSLAIPILMTFVAGTAAFFLAVYALLFKKERSIIMVFPVIIGLMILWFGIAEMFGNA